MSYIGFMRNTVSHIEKLFNKYMENSRAIHRHSKKEDYKNFVFQRNASTDTAR